MKVVKNNVVVDLAFVGIFQNFSTLAISPRKQYMKGRTCDILGFAKTLMVKLNCLLILRVIPAKKIDKTLSIWLDYCCRQSHFHRVILMSGSIFSGWARVDNPAEVNITRERYWWDSIVALGTNLLRWLHLFRPESKWQDLLVVPFQQISTPTTPPLLTASGFCQNKFRSKFSANLAWTYLIFVTNPTNMFV